VRLTGAGDNKILNLRPLEYINFDTLRKIETPVHKSVPNSVPNSVPKSVRMRYKSIGYGRIAIRGRDKVASVA
jgi:hypothetical protein